MDTPCLRRSSRRLSSRDKSATKVEQNNTTLGPKSMAKLKKAAAKLKENDLMNKTAPVEAIEEAQVGRKKRSRSVTNESAKKVKVQLSVKTENVKKELIKDDIEIEQKEPKTRSGRKTKSTARKSSTARSDSSPIEESKSAASSNVSSTSAGKEIAPVTNEIVTESTNIENNTTEKITEQIVKEEPSSFKSEVNSVEECLEDISLIDLTEADNIENPTIEITAPVENSETEINKGIEIKRTSRVYFKKFEKLVENAENEGSIDDIEQPSFITSVLKTPKSVKIEALSNEGLENKTPATAKRDDKLNETFSPIVDVSINDSRPNIDQALSFVEPTVALKSVTNRTSTPFASKPMTRHYSADKKRLTSSTLAAKVNDSMMIANPLEKSILKSSRKRSMSVHDMIDDHVASKRVMFISPQFMEISKIDEKMMASFIGAKENSIVKTNPRQRRSQSAGPSSDRATRVRKMPDFKAIHESNFNKMESIGEHVTRKANRAKKLLTPEPKKAAELKQTKIPGPVIAKPVVRPKLELNAEAKKKPTPTTPKRKPLADKQQQPVLIIPKVEPKSFITKTASNTTINKFVGTTAKAGDKPAAISNVVANRIKVEERRDRNMSLYKTNHVQRATNETRQKNMTIIKGVRSNRRFELQMQQRYNNGNSGNP